MYLDKSTRGNLFGVRVKNLFGECTLYGKSIKIKSRKSVKRT